MFEEFTINEKKPSCLGRPGFLYDIDLRRGLLIFNCC